MNEALSLENISKKYQNFALQNVNISLPAGSIMGFIGENGAGKSTTMKALLGLIHCDSGNVYINGSKFTGEETDIKEQIGVVMDTSCFPDELTAKDVGRVMSYSYRNWDERVFQEHLKSFRVEPVKKIKDYSRGMKMKLSMAVALSHGAKILVLDEATSGLDPLVRDSMLDLFMEFIQDETHSILISSHILSDLEKICDYITFIHDGRILFSKSKDELLEEYRVVKGSSAQIQNLNQEKVIGIKTNAFGVEALVDANAVPNGMVSDPAGIEEIMLYFVRREQR